MIICKQLTYKTFSIVIYLVSGIYIELDSYQKSHIGSKTLSMILILVSDKVRSSVGKSYIRGMVKYFYWYVVLGSD